jgi:mono/diheme cytochrome c family protein
MKKILKGVLYVFLAVILLIIFGATYIAFKGIPKYKTHMSDHLTNLHVQRDSVNVARGERIASMLCVKCHMGSDHKVTGKPIYDLPAQFGTVHSFNITQDPEVGIGRWKDGEIIYFLKTGIKPDGTYAPPYMPKFPLMADEDIESIVAWLRSDRPIVQASQKIQPKNQPNFLIKFLCNTVMKPLPIVQERIALPDSSDQVARGRYLSTAVLGCFSCHSANFTSNNEMHPELSVGFFGGGNPLLDMEGKTRISQNITFDQTSGIGKYSENDFLQTLKYGKRPDGSITHYPMEPFTSLTDEEVKCIYSYLKTVPVIHNNN